MRFDVLLGPKWLATNLNVLADCLSRGNFQDFPYLGRKFAAARRVWASQPHSYMLAQDFDDWKIDPALFSTWDAQFGPFHVDGCADAFGANSQLDSYWTDFEAHGCAGLNVYANLPFSNLETLLLHFLKAKRRCPLGTAGLLVLPFWPDKAFWTHIVLALPDVFKIIQRFEKGSRIFTSPHAAHGARKNCGPTRWPVVVVRVSPQVPLSADWERVFQHFA